MILCADINYQLDKAIGTNVTYGVLVESIFSGSPPARAGLKARRQSVAVDDSQYVIGGDFVSINGTKITGNQSLAAYLEE